MRTTTVFLSAALTAVAIAAPHEGHDHTEDSVAAAQDSVKMFLPMADAQELLAYEIEVGAEATTYAVGCPSDASSDECGFPSGFLYTGGPKTVAYTMASPEYGYTVDIACSVGGTTTASCTIQYTGEETVMAQMEGQTSTQMTFDSDYNELAWATAAVVAEPESILNYEAALTGTGAVADSQTQSGTGTFGGPDPTQPPRQTGTGAADDEEEGDATESDGEGALVSSTSSGFAAQMTAVPFMAGAAAVFMAGVAAL